MDNLNLIIADNLKKLREKRKLSLENASKLTGVSKSMIGQIERGEVNPTISTIWKLTNGFKISFTELMDRPESDVEIVDKSEIEPLLEDSGKYRNYPLFPFDSNRRFEMYIVEIDENGHLEAQAHPKGTQEFVSVFSGNLNLVIKGQEYLLDENKSMRFNADCNHSYFNAGKGVCRLSMVIFYPEQQ